MKNKTILLLLGLSLCFVKLTNAQNAVNPLDSINSQLRLMFSNTTPPPLHVNPSLQVRYLYDMAAHMVDSEFYEPIVSKASNTENWFMIYDELKNMAYDTVGILETDSLYNKAFLQAYRDTIPLGIMFQYYYTLTSDALNTGLYFEFDTVNNLLYDKDDRPDGICNNGPYCLKQVFSISPLTSESDFATVAFTVDPNYFFIDSSIQASDLIYKIDLGDGLGFRNLNISTYNYLTATYESTGAKEIVIEVFSGTNLIAESRSTFKITGLNIRIVPDYEINYIEGMSIGVFGSCVSEGSSRKIAIVLEGADFYDFLPEHKSTSSNDIYDQIIKQPKLEELRRYGYEFWVVNWSRSFNDIKVNASLLEALLYDINNNTTNDTVQPHVIIGVSMGGVIARYALAKMEAENTPHNVRELITIDSPHEGANVPLSIQKLYKDLTFFRDINFIPRESRLIAKALNIGLYSPAARQILIYHIESADDFCDASIYKCYESSSARYEFINDLAAVGNWPQYCKLVAVTNGSLSGEPQSRIYNSTYRSAGDKLLEFHGEIYVRILKIIKVRIIGGDVELMTNPDGDGKFYQFNCGLYVPRIKLYWFGVRLKKVDYSSFWDQEEYGNNLKPYCVNAGGVFALENFQPGGTSFEKKSNEHLAFLFKVNRTNNGNGLYEFEMNVGNPWLASANLNFSIYSDGFHFSFIPVQSSISYTNFNVNDPDLNLIGGLPTQIMSKTPFDVVIGPNTGFPKKVGDAIEYLYIKNTPHTALASRINNVVSNNCHTLGNNTCGNQRRILNTEIGEDILWLDNYTHSQPTNSIFSAVNLIVVNKFSNPLFTYDGFVSDSCDTLKPIAFSKSNLFLVVNSPELVFQSTQISFDQTPNYDYRIISDPPVYCCSLITRGINTSADILPVDSNDKLLVNIFPNYFNDELNLNVSNIRFLNTEIYVTITDNLGRIIYRGFLGTNTSSNFQYIVNTSLLPVGQFYIRIDVGKESKVFKIQKNQK